MEITDINEDTSILERKLNIEKRIATNTKINVVNIDSKLSSSSINYNLIKSVVRRQLSNLRSRTNQPKTRAEVSGTTRKVRGTKKGKSRMGNQKAPQLRGGGSTKKIGTTRFNLKINKKEFKSAKIDLFKSYALKKSLFIVEDFDLKTIQSLNTLKLNNITGKILLIHQTSDNIKSYRNIKMLKTCLTTKISPVKLLHKDSIMITRQAYDSYLHEFTKQWISIN